MLLATVLLSAALVPQTPPAEAETPFDTAPGESAAVPGFEPEETPGLEATPTTEAEVPAAASAVSAPAVQENIDAGLKAFIRGRFSTAREAFQKAHDADPRSAAAAFYLGYACYKLGEPSRRMDPNKARAKELFATAYDLDPAFEPVWGRKKAE